MSQIKSSQSTENDTQQQQSQHSKSCSTEPPRLSVQSDSPMAVESCYDGSPKSSWREQRHRRPQSPILNSSHEREGCKRRSLEGDNLSRQHPSHKAGSNQLPAKQSRGIGDDVSSQTPCTVTFSSCSATVIPTLTPLPGRSN